MIGNFFDIIIEGLRMDGAGYLFLWFVISAAFSLFCWWVCTHYTRLWNRKYNVTTGFHIFCAAAALVTFSSALCFIGLKNMRYVAQDMVDEWTTEAQGNYQLQNKSFISAFNAVEASGLEDMRGFRKPEDGGDVIPVSHSKTQILVSSIYSSAACSNFYENYPFLGWFLKADEGVPSELIADDINAFFSKNTRAPYPLERGFQLGIEQINTQLQEQTGRIVRISRLWLLAIFLTVQLIPFGAIGYLAYRDIFDRHSGKEDKEYTSDDFNLNL